MKHEIKIHTHEKMRRVILTKRSKRRFRRPVKATKQEGYLVEDNSQTLKKQK